MPERKNPSETLERLRSRILDGPGQLEGALRRRAFHNDFATLPTPIGVYVDKVHRHAYEVTDDDTEGLRQAGLSEDQIFELTVAAALGAGLSRFERAQAARSKSYQ